MNSVLLFIGNLGMQEILLVGLFVLIFFGANKIPEFMRGLGKGVREFKDSIKDVRKDIEDAGSAARIEDGKYGLKNYGSFREIRNDLQSGTLSCQDLVKHYLSNIAEKSHLNVFLSVYGEEALHRAAEVDKKIQANTAGKLAGLVVGIKDVLAYKDH